MKVRNATLAVQRETKLGQRCLNILSSPRGPVLQLQIGDFVKSKKRLTITMFKMKTKRKRMQKGQFETKVPVA